MTKYRWLALAGVIAILVTGFALGQTTAEADVIEGPSVGFNGGGPEVRGGNHPETTTTTAPTTTTTAPTTTTTQATTTTTEAFVPASDAEIASLAQSMCDAFETAYLSELVDVILTTMPEVSTPDVLELIGLGIAGWCPERSAMFASELVDQYPEYVDEVTAGLKG